MTSREQIEDTAREALGLEALRPGQLEVAEAVLEGRDALAIMATGYGKSAIYQLAGLLIDGPTLVVSPLIALQRDQVERLEADDDLCDAGEAVAGADGPYAVGARGAHPKWGDGTVQRYEDQKVVLLFDSVGCKALSLDAVEDNDLLEPA